MEININSMTELYVMEKNKMLIVFQTVKQLLFTTIGFQRRSHLHINVNEVSSNHLFDSANCENNTEGKFTGLQY
jgi:hypothetical protein